jgi:hypothetical protein
MKKTVWVVQNLDLGWDNVVALFNLEDYTFEQLNEVFPEESRYYIDTKQISVDAGEYK